MQDQVDTKELAKRKKDSLWSIIAALILMSLSVWFFYVICRAPHAEWRNAYTKLPWEAAGVCIDEAEASWKSAKGDSRMELRAYCYPECRFVLSKASGQGYLSVRMYDSYGTQMGDRVLLHYQDGKFKPTNNNSAKVSENEAIIRLEDGFKTQDLYKLHQVNEKENYWKVEVTCHPAEGEAEQMGYVSVIPHDL